MEREVSRPVSMLCNPCQIDNATAADRCSGGVTVGSLSLERDLPRSSRVHEVIAQLLRFSAVPETKPVTGQHGCPITGAWGAGGVGGSGGSADSTRR